jgi:hypothetical protein
MPAFVESERSPNAWTAPVVKPLDEVVWQTWLANGLEHDRRSCSARLKAANWTSIVGLLVAAALWSHLAPFEVVVRSLVTAGALIVMFQALQIRQYAVAVVFGALAVLYNPVAPMFSFSGDWQRAFVVASAVPFVWSLTLRNTTKARTEHNA